MEEFSAGTANPEISSDPLSLEDLKDIAPGVTADGVSVFINDRAFVNRRGTLIEQSN